MAHYQVYWRTGKEGPRASHWYTLGGVITWASPVLKRWVGKRHGDLIGSLWATGQRTPILLDHHCVPPTIAYHKQLSQCLAALVEEQP